MSRRIVMLMGVAVLLAAPMIFAQLNPALEAEIPFTFEAGKSVLPAGQYRVTAGPSQGVIELACPDSKVRMFVSTNAVRSLETVREGKLVFHRYGNRYFLWQIWNVGTDTGRELMASKAEKELARSAGAGQTVVVSVR
ncbi:MAG TPA: hypothetical protein VNJ11_01825 [Bryobacteraceae bacterium]|nr:hypothetical protein [Bryobacteraceae bacterium]